MALSKILPASQDQYVGARNIIINGNVACSQRATSATSITSNGYHTVDRWNVNFDGSALSHKQEQSTDTPNGFGYSLKITATTQDASLDANQNYQLDQRFEGQNLQQLKKGTSDAQSVTLSFWVKSSLTGIFICAFNDLDTSGQRTVSGSYTINLANTWEYKTITFPPDTTGAFNNDNGLSARLIFCLAAGSNFTTGTLATTWEASSGGVNTYVGQTNLFATLNATWQITGIQLEIGEVATPFEHRSFGEEQQLCFRYYYDSRFGSNDGGAYSPGRDAQYGHVRACIAQFPVKMRATPTVSIQSGNANSMDRFGRGQEQCFPKADNIHSDQFQNIVKFTDSGQSTTTNWTDNGLYINRAGYKADAEL